MSWIDGNIVEVDEISSKQNTKGRTRYWRNCNCIFHNVVHLGLKLPYVRLQSQTSRGFFLHPAFNRYVTVSSSAV